MSQAPPSSPPAAKPMRTEAPYKANLQALGKVLVAQLFMVLRTIKLHDRGNKSVVVATEHLKDTLNTVHSVAGEVKLEFVEDQVYLSEQRIRLDAAGQEGVKELSRELNKRGMGGLTFLRPVNTTSLTEFLVAFSEVADETDAAAKLRDRVRDLRDLAVELLGRRSFADTAQAPAELKIDPRLLALQTYAKAVIAVKRFVADVQSSEKGEQSQGGMRLKLVRIVQDLVDMANERVNLLIKLLAIKDCTDYPYNHAVNVCVLSVAMGRAVGLERNELVDLGMAAIMSDLGFTIAYPELHDKAATLDQQELAEMHEHALAAVRLLIGKGTLSQAAQIRLLVAFQHHIHFDLKGGYPSYGNTRPLHVYSRIVAIADNYDALTTQRPWREAYGPDEALKIINQGAGTKFDPTLVRVLVNLLGLYPIGTLVRLSSGEIGIVYHTTDDPTRFDRPFVRVLRDANGKAVERTLLRDLTEQSGGEYRYSIVETIEAGAIGTMERAAVFNG